jgi:selenocysteine-specific elongation factor
MIVATAGHIDHGKTSLVRALTGVDTDRLPEEKARGISIDLGFAYLHTDAGLIGFVDVPGHERFVKNMLAGVAGIDFAVLVVAADDGVMPQTREHLQILHLLDVRRGLVALSKVDRVPPERCEAVTRELRDLLQGSALEGIAVHRVSTVTGDGVAELREALVGHAGRHRSRFCDGRGFRLAVDRVFSAPGTGTVVTGTVFAGRVARGDRRVVAPAGHEVRVRGIEVRGRAVDGVQAGERCALALGGVETAQVRRGDWIVDAGRGASTERIDVLLRVLPSEEEGLAHWTPLHLHLGTDALTARVSTPRSQPIAPGSSAHVQLVLDRGVPAVNGDRYVVRDRTGRRTIGGGFVLDPFAPRRRAGPLRAAWVAALECRDPTEALRALLATAPGGVPLEPYMQTFNLPDGKLDAVLADCGAIVLGREPRLILPAAELARLECALVDEVAAFHRLHPAAPGIEPKALRQRVSCRLPPEALNAVLRDLARSGRLLLKGGLASPPRHDTTANPADERLWAEVAPVLRVAGLASPTPTELARMLGVEPARLVDFLHRKSKTGQLLRIADDRFYLRDTGARLAGIARQLSQADPGGLFTAAQYRDATGLNRNWTIKILEFLDGAGVTKRVGDARRFRPEHADAFGDPPAVLHRPEGLVPSGPP